MLDGKYLQPSPNSRTKSLNAGIQLGKVIKENTILGVIGSYRYSRQYNNNAPDSNVSKGTQYSAGVFLRKYKKLAKDLYLFGDVSATHFHSKNTLLYFANASEGYNNLSNGLSVSFAPGMAYAISKRSR